MSCKYYLIAGPPGAGKTTRARELLEQPGLILDLDEINAALCNLQPHQHPDEMVPFACEAREAIQKRLLLPHRLKMAVLIECCPKKWNRDWYEFTYGATVEVLDPGIEVCKHRVKRREIDESIKRRQLMAIDEWYGYFD